MKGEAKGETSSTGGDCSTTSLRSSHPIARKSRVFGDSGLSRKAWATRLLKLGHRCEIILFAISEPRVRASGRYMVSSLNMLSPLST
jgi:hypothetical protein